MAERLTPEQLQQATKAIQLLSSLTADRKPTGITPGSTPRAQPSPSSSSAPRAVAVDSSSTKDGKE